MALFIQNVLTLADWAKRLDPSGNTSLVVELLAQMNEILDDMIWGEGNLPTGDRVTVRTGLPQVFWRLLNQGISSSKSTTAQIDEQTGMLEAWCEIDKDLAELNGNTNEFRLSEATAFIEAMNQEMASTVFYGNSGVAPEQFNGLSVRYSSLSANNGSNIVNCGGTGSNNSSIWLNVWGRNSIYGIFPKGSKAGIVHENEGLVTIENVAGIGGARMRGYRDHWQWKCGIALKDWRYVVRGANINITNLVNKTSPTDITETLIRMIHRVPNLKMGRPAIYMNRTVYEMFDLYRREDVKAGGQLKFEVVDGVMTPTFRGIPVRKCDALLTSEAAVS